MKSENEIEYSKDRCIKPVDVYVGTRMRLRRTQIGMSQETLARILGVTYQQIQKYEKAINRIGASRLFEISRALDTNIAYFFAEIELSRNTTTYRKSDQEWLYNEAGYNQFFADVDLCPDNNEIFDLVKVYYSIPMPTRKRFLELVNSLTKTKTQ